MTGTERKSGSALLKILPGLVISVLAIYLLSKIVDWQQVGVVLTTISPVYILVTVVLTLAFIFVRSIGWRVLLQEKISLKESFLGICVGYLVNNILPLRAGEVARGFLIGKRSGLGTLNVLSTIVIERMFDLAFAAVWLLVTLPLALQLDWAKTVAIITLIVIISGFALLYVAALNRHHINRWMDALGRKAGWFDKKIKPLLNSLMEGLAVITDLRRFLISLISVGLSWFVAVLAYGFVLMGFVKGAPLWWGAFTNSMLAMGIALPAAPASLGVFEGAIVGALSILGIDYNTALGYGLFMHAMQIVTTGILGAYGLAFFGTSLKTLFQRSIAEKEGAE